MMINSEIKDGVLTGIAHGKLRRLKRLSDADGRFAMLAIDQRGSLRKMLATQSKCAVNQVSDADISLVKEIITEAVGPSATAVLTDPIYGYPSAFHVLPGDVGIMLAIETTGYEAVNQVERLSRLIDGWTVERIARSGADGVKLLIWHNSHASPATHDHQQSVVRSIGKACRDAEMPFVLEIVTYSLDGQGDSSIEHARMKPHLVRDAVKTYSDSQFGVDLLKIEFPVNLRYCSSFETGQSPQNEQIFDLSDVEEHCREVDQAASVPWVILSAGVDPPEFLHNIRIANRAGASGFLCGRAVWKKVIGLHPNQKEMASFARETARRYFQQMREANSNAAPWFQRMSTYRSDRPDFSAI